MLRLLQETLISAIMFCYRLGNTVPTVKKEYLKESVCFTVILEMAADDMRLRISVVNVLK